MSTIARVEFPPPADLTIDSNGNVLVGRSVTAKLAGTATNVTHYSALTGGTSTTGGLFTHTDGTIVNGSGNRRYVDSGTTMDITIAGRSRQVEALSASVESKVPEVSVKDPAYGARGDGSTDDTAAIAAAITAASALGSASKRVRVYFPLGTYLVDSILLKSNTWVDFGGATIKKRIDGAGTSTDCLVRALEVDLGGGNYYGTYSNIKVSGGYLDPNGKTCPGHVFRMNFVDGWEIDGVTITAYPADAKWAFMLGGRKGLIQRCKVLGGTVVFQDGIHIWGGQDIRVLSNYVESGDDAIAIGSEAGWQDDPIRGINCVNNTVRAEKGYALKVYVNTGLATRTVSDVVVSGLTGQAGITRNGGVGIWDVNGSAAGSNPINGVTVRGMDLKLGSTTHDETNAYGVWVQSASEVSVEGRVRITEKTGATTGFKGSFIRDSQEVRVDLNCPGLGKSYGAELRASKRVNLGGVLVQNSTGTASGIFIRDCTDVKIRTHLVDIQSGQIGVEISGISSKSTVTLDGARIFHASGATAGSAISASSSVCDRLDVVGGDVSGAFQAFASLANVRLIPKISVPGVRGASEPAIKARFFDDFWGDLLADEWAGWKGSDAAAVVPTSVGAVNGAVRLTTGADAAGTHTVNGSRLDTSKNWAMQQGLLVFECRCSISAITNVLLFVGFASTTGSAQNPAELNGSDVVAYNPADLVGFLFDTNALTDNWWLVGRAASSAATPQNTGLAPVAATNAIFRIEITTAGVATFFYNGAPIGTAMTGAISNVQVTPVISAVSRAAASRNIDVDYILVEQNR